MCDPVYKTLPHRFIHISSLCIGNVFACHAKLNLIERASCEWSIIAFFTSLIDCFK